MWQNSEKCPFQVPRPKGDAINLHIQFNQQSKTQKDSISNDIKQSQSTALAQTEIS